mmetsp:Transcript_36247/g.77311  ORF Transcript_36247/g.77311 Transcript_36247/m.77311 type:complete len:292 (-) Transcript_36247:137-1012(-)
MRWRIARTSRMRLPGTTVSVARPSCARHCRRLRCTSKVLMIGIIFSVHVVIVVGVSLGSIVVVIHTTLARASEPHMERRAPPANHGHWRVVVLAATSEEDEAPSQGLDDDPLCGDSHIVTYFHARIDKPKFSPNKRYLVCCLFAQEEHSSEDVGSRFVIVSVQFGVVKSTDIALLFSPAACRIGFREGPAACRIALQIAHAEFRCEHLCNLSCVVCDLLAVTRNWLEHTHTPIVDCSKAAAIRRKAAAIDNHRLTPGFSPAVCKAVQLILRRMRTLQPLHQREILIVPLQP